MRSFTGWIITVCFFAALVAGFFILKNVSSGAPFDVSFATTTAPASASSSAAAKTPQNALAGYKGYRNKDYGFSVYHPAEITPQEFHDRGDALTVLFQGAAGEPGFQIAVAPINGATITPERFNVDEPSGVKLEPRDTVIDGAPAITFFGFDAGVGQTREIWFIHNHLLYEVLTYKQLDSWLSDIMETWRFI